MSKLTRDEIKRLEELEHERDYWYEKAKELERAAISVVSSMSSTLPRQRNALGEEIEIIPYKRLAKLERALLASLDQATQD